MDDPTVDWLVLVVVTFVAGLFYGAAGYFLLGPRALARREGGRRRAAVQDRPADRRLRGGADGAVARSSSCPAIAIGFGADWFRTGGDDEGTGRTVVVGIGLAFAAWSLGLVALGLRGRRSGCRGEASWPRSLLAAVIVAAFAVLPRRCRGRRGILVSRRPAADRGAERVELLLGHPVRVHLLGEAVLAHVVGIRGHGVADRGREIGVALDEPRRLAL